MSELSINPTIIKQTDELSNGINYTVDESISAADVKDFESELIHIDTTPKASFSDQVIEKFGAVSEDMSIKKSEFEYKLAKAANTGDPNDILEATRAMADYQLQVQITSKVASKTNSAIEKITNLQ